VAGRSRHERKKASRPPAKPAPRPPSARPSSPGKNPGKQVHGKSRLQAWQGVVIASIAAAATVVAAWITAHDASPSASPNQNPTPSVQPTPARTSAAPQPDAAQGDSQFEAVITSFALAPSHSPSGEVYVFRGTVAPYRLDGGRIFVIARRPAEPTASGASGSPWLVSPAARILGSGRWVVKWRLANPIPSATWTAVVVFLVPVEPITITPAPMDTPFTLPPNPPPVGPVIGRWHAAIGELRRHGLTARDVVAHSAGYTT
jgi:hypothetical protein